MKEARGVPLIGLFCNHPVAANLLMVMMLMAGFWSLKQLNTQFFPSFDIDFVTVQTTWRGASAEDVESLITVALEQELRDVDMLKEMSSISGEGSSVIWMEFEEGADMGLAVGEVKERVDLLRDLPVDAELPKVSRVVRYEEVASVLVSGSGGVEELRGLVRGFEVGLLGRGIAKVSVRGLAEEYIAIELGAAQLRRLGMSLEEVGRRVEGWSQDVPAGIVGRAETSRQLRFRERRTSALGFESVPVVAADGYLLTLGDVAEVRRKVRDGQESLQYRGKAAVEMTLLRAESGDSLEAARIFREWLADTRPTLPVGVELVAYNEQWELLQERIDLLVKNGVGGLVLVVGILFLFLIGRVAWWTAVGIPVSFMAALAGFYLVGGSINMISLLGLIMALGIIVDDAIVVGEQAMTSYEHGVGPRRASQRAAQQMLWPVFSSSLTTIAAFMPLLLVGGIIGTIMQAVPVVVMCVIVASLVECFLILPGHLTQSFRHMHAYRPGRVRRVLEGGFEGFRRRVFRPLVKVAVGYRWSTVAVGVAMLVATMGWVQSGRLGFQFFPVAEGDRLYAQVGFVAGAPASEVQVYLEQVARELRAVEVELDEELVELVVIRHGVIEGGEGGHGGGGGGGRSGDHFGTVQVELVAPERRQARNRDIIAAWRGRLPGRAGLEFLSIVEPRAGPPGRDIDIRIAGGDVGQVKSVALQLQDSLRGVVGVSGVGDDSPYGREQLVLRLTPTAEAVGLTVGQVSRQLRAAYSGYAVPGLSDGYDDVEVRVLLAEGERDGGAGLVGLPVVLPGGGSARLDNLVTLHGERGFETIRRSDGRRAMTVTASVDAAVNNANRVIAELEAGVLPRLESEYGVRFYFGGRHADQAETLGDMQLGMVLALGLIYLVLAWVFGSYGWPLVVMFIIPFGVVGALWGHVAMGQDVTVLSLFGFFALSGIVVNDSIILVVAYQHLRDEGVGVGEAAVEAACRRLRAVLLTSLTTIGGLTPLLFETSLQAQFLIPMATTLAFGLGFSTLLVLLVLPALLMIYEGVRGVGKG